jgi:hypothetical protein
MNYNDRTIKGFGQSLALTEGKPGYLICGGSNLKDNSLLQYQSLPAESNLKQQKF